MLIWGSRGAIRNLGQVETRHCEACEKDRPYNLMLQYKISHIWYVFRWVSEKKYLLLCDICQRGQQLKTKQADALLKSNPIPLWTRYSWVLLVVCIAAAIGYAQVDSTDREARDMQFISAPLPGDMYLMNLAKLMKTPDEPYMYGIVKVHTVMDGVAEVYLPGTYSNKERGVEQDLRSSKVANPEYFRPETVKITVANLVAMRHSLTITEVRR